MDLCAVEVSAERIWSLLASALLYIVPNLHVNAWVLVWLEFLTVRTNQRATEDNGECRLPHAPCSYCGGTIDKSQGTRWRTGG